jgi:hypothetical protein
MKRNQHARFDSKWIEQNRAHLDADSLFFARELQHTLPEMFRVQYAERIARRFVSTGQLIDRTVPTVRREIFDIKGRAKRATNPADDAPQVSLSSGEDFATMQDYHLGTQFGDNEVDVARRLGRPLETMKLEAVRTGLLNTLDDHITEGDSGVGNLGLVNQTGTNDVTADLTGDWMGAATGDQILDDLFTIFDKAQDATSEVEKSKRLLMSPRLERKISRMPRTSTSDKTVLHYFKEQRPNAEIMTWERLNGVGAAGKDRCIAYDPDPSKIRLLLAYEFELDPPERKGRAHKVTAWMRNGGIWLLSPKSMTYGDVSGS